MPIVQPKASGWAHVTWSWHKPRQRKNKRTRRDAITLAALISNVGVKNMGDCMNINEKLIFL